MNKENEKKSLNELLKDLPLQAENSGFAPEEMVFCAKCKRTNAPTRAKCFYCGEELQMSEEQNRKLKPILRKLEAWEKGFNVVFLSKTRKLNEGELADIAKTLNLEKTVLQKIFEVNKFLPLTRVESQAEADVIKKQLSESGIETIVVSDNDLAAEKPPQRLRRIEFFEEKLGLILFNQNEIINLAKDELALIVTGTIFQKRLEAIEKRGKKGENKILQAVETASDEILFDLYSRQNPGGFRIFGKGFDFSCLENEKKILAVENMKKLIQKLREVASDVKIIDDYLQVRENLGNVWEIEHKTDSLGLTRERFGKFNLGNVTTVNNTIQFTKYSRLQKHLI